MTVPDLAVGRPLPPPGLVPGGRFVEWEPQPVRYVVADVDGTLVGSAGTVTDIVVAAATRAAGAGVQVGFATGRMRLGVTHVWDRLRLPGPHVLHNGAQVRADGHTVAAWPLAPAGVAAVLDIADRRGHYVELYLEDGYLVSAMDHRARPHWELLGHEPLGVVRDADDIDEPVLKATYCLFDAAALEGLVADLHGAGLSAGPAGSPMTPTLTYVNATDPAVDKGRAVAAAAGHLGVPLASVVAIGDATNDLPMLAVAGTAVAMGQAPPALHAAAHLVAPSVDDDGVAAVLDALVRPADRRRYA